VLIIFNLKIILICKILNFKYFKYEIVSNFVNKFLHCLMHD